MNSHSNAAAIDDSSPIDPDAKPLALFDMDGTLTDPAEGITTCHVWACAEVGVEVDPAAATALIGMVAEDMHRELGVPDDKLAESTRLYRERFAVAGWLEDTPYEGIPELVGSLHAAGFLVGVATMKLEPFAERIVERVGLSPYISVVAGSDSARTRITKRAIIERAVELTGVTPSGIAMVGDRHHDIDAARSLGYTSIGAAWGFGSVEELMRANAHAIAMTPPDVAEFLLKGV